MECNCTPAGVPRPAGLRCPMHALDFSEEISGHIEALCDTTQRELERILDRLIHNANLLAEYGPEDAESRGEIAQLALDYATQTWALDKYRSLLRRGDAPIARVK